MADILNATEMTPAGKFQHMSRKHFSSVVKNNNFLEMSKQNQETLLK